MTITRAPIGYQHYTSTIVTLGTNMSSITCLIDEYHSVVNIKWMIMCMPQCILVGLKLYGLEKYHSAVHKETYYVYNIHVLAERISIAVCSNTLGNHWGWKAHIHDLVLDCSNSSVLAMELLQFCTQPSIYSIFHNQRTYCISQERQEGCSLVLKNTVCITELCHHWFR